MKGKTLGLSLLVVMVLFQGIAWGASAVPVSPGDAGGAAFTGQNCPTFSWSAADSAVAYRLEVYEQAAEPVPQEKMAAMALPVLVREVSAPALSWTPSTGECLARGFRYVWYVRGVTAEGSDQWSSARSFQVEASVLSVEQKDAVEEVVKGYLAADRASPVAEDLEATVGGTGTATVRTSAGITPLGYEGATNTAYGTNAGASISSGTNNTMVGKEAGYYTASANNDSFYGSGAGRNTTSGSTNSYFGWGAGNNGDYNCFLGWHAGYGSTGSKNSFFGYDAGTGVGSSGSSRVLLGREAGKEAVGSNALYIANSSTSSPLIYGEFDNRVVRINGSLTMVTVATPSDFRYKKEIHTLESPLDKVLQLQGVTYEWDRDKVKGAGFKPGRQIGLIAQEAEKILPELVHTGKDDYKTLQYDKVGPVLIEALKEMQKEIMEKDVLIGRLEKTLAMMEGRLASLEKSANKVALKQELE